MQTDLLISQAHRRLLLVILCFAQFMIIFNATVVFVALPSIQHDLDFSHENLTWIVNSYILMFGSFLIIGGRSADIFGRKKIFIVGVAIFCAASLSSGLAVSQSMFLVSRGFQGIGAALMAPATLSILTTTFSSGRERHRALVLWGIANAGSSSVSLFLGGGVIDRLSWPWIYFINVPLGLMIAAAVVRYAPDSRRISGTSLDVGGAVTLGGGVIALVFSTVNGRQNGWYTPSTVLTGAIAVLSLSLFFAIQRGHPTPLVRLEIFRIRTLSIANLIMFLLSGTWVIVIYIFTLYLQNVMDYSAWATGVALLPAAAAASIGSFVSQWFIPRIGIRLVLGMSLALTALGPVALMEVGMTAERLSESLAIIGVMFIGIGCGAVALTILATMDLSDDGAGLAAGLINTSQQLGSAGWLAVLSVLAATHKDLSDAAGSGGAIRNVAEFQLAAALAVIATILAFGLLRNGSRRVNPSIEVG